MSISIEQAADLVHLTVESLCHQACEHGKVPDYARSWVINSVRSGAMPGVVQDEIERIAVEWNVSVNVFGALARPEKEA